MSRDKLWQKLEDYIVERLKEIDPFCKPTKQSGGGTIKNDIQTSCGLGIECKQRASKSVTIDYKVWEKLNEEIPLHSNKIPVLALPPLNISIIERLLSNSLNWR